MSPAQLRDPAQLVELWRRGAAAGYWPLAAASLLGVFTAAHAAKSRGQDGPALFVWLLKHGALAGAPVVLQADEDAARRQLLDGLGRSRRETTAPVGSGSTASCPPIGPVIVQLAGRLGVYTGFGRPHVEPRPAIRDSQPVSKIAARQLSPWLREAPAAELQALAAAMDSAGPEAGVAQAAAVLRALAATRAA